MSALEKRIAELRKVCAGLLDRRKGPLPAGAYSMADIGLSAFSLFFMSAFCSRLLANGPKRHHG